MKWNEIPRFISDGDYEINMPLDFMLGKLRAWETDPYYGLQLNPDFQRGHVWTQEQQEKYVEYFFKGGVSGMVIYFNKPSWQSTARTEYDDFVCVDGLQRLTALTAFLNNEIKAFNQFHDEFGSRIRLSAACDKLRFNINNLKTKKEVLNWYLQMNSGGTPHTESELNKVRGLLKTETK